MVHTKQLQGGKSYKVKKLGNKVGSADLAPSMRVQAINRNSGFVASTFWHFSLNFPGREGMDWEYF
jgi:hypothetical protein